MKKIITAKEQFEKAVKDAQYVDEVCDVHYYYMENDNFGYLFSCYEHDKQYFSTQFDKFSEMYQKYGMAIAKHFIDHYEDSEHLKEIIATNGEELPKGKALTWYCDFLFCNAQLANSQHAYEDEYEEVEDNPNIIGAEHTDINAISSMVEFLKRQLINKIDGIFDCMNVDKFEINPLNELMFIGLYPEINTYYLTRKDTIKIEYYCCEDGTTDWCDLNCASIEELLYIYSQLHN